MIKRYPCQAVMMYVLGIVYMASAGTWIPASADGLLAAVCAIGCAALWIRQQTSARKKSVQAMVLLLAFGIGAARMYAADTMERSLTGILDGQEVSVQGRITKKQLQEASNQNILWNVNLTDSYLKTSQGIRPCGNVIIYTDLKSGEPVIGNTIFITGKIKLWNTARNEGNFDERAYYKNQGYAFRIYADKYSYQVMEPGRDSLREYLYNFRQQLVQVYQSRMQEQTAGVVCAMLLGEKSLLEAETKELYRQSGIAHILAISGLHISILGAAAFGMLRKRGVSYTVSAAVSLSLLLLFGIMTGMGLSTVRAIVMFGIYLGAACCGRAYDSINALAVAAAWILWHNPRSLFLAGFQFSFAAVIGVLFGKQICQVFRPKYRLFETVLVSLGIQMATLPLTAWYYYEIPVYSVLLNMLVLPLMGIVLISGLFGGVCGIFACGGIGIMAAVMDGISRGLLGLCSLLLGFFSGAGELFFRFPGAVYVSGQPRVWQMAGAYLILAVCASVLCRRQEYRRSSSPQERRRSGSLQEHRRSGSPQQTSGQSGRRICCSTDGNRKKLTAAGSLAACLCLLLFRPLPQAQVVFLDVGQGDGIYIRTSDGVDVMIDGGSTDLKQAGTYRILPFLKSRGIAGIDYWFLSHLDQDHISGFLEIAESGYPIGEVVCADGIVKDEAYHKVMGILASQQIKVRYLKKGDLLRAETSSFSCLAPGAEGPANDRNANSLVLLYEDSGFRGFFSGDISQKEELALQEGGTGLAPVMVYKAAHHGSDHSNAQMLLEQLRPRISVISCAKENSYGHPGEAAVANMERFSGDVAGTMHAGQICVLPQKEGAAIQTYTK